MSDVTTLDTQFRHVIWRLTKSRPLSPLSFLRVYEPTTRHQREWRVMMWNKPFKPPLLKQAPKPVVRNAQDDLSETSSPPRQAKKRRLLIHVVDDSPPQSRTLPTHSPAVNAPRKPLLNITNPVAAAQAASTPCDGREGYYLVLWYSIQHLMRATSISLITVI